MRRRIPSWLPSIAVAVAVFAALPLIAIFRTPDTYSDNTPAQIEIPTDADAGWSRGHDGASANAEEHWEKHGSEFSEDHSAADYEDEASNFIHNPPPGAEIKHRANGDTLIYDSNTNTFAVEDRNGKPRTMFKPDRGRAYWDRQH